TCSGPATGRLSIPVPPEGESEWGRG
ncbi:hypothetical protein GA0115246_105421, partial [Streptomyces sp. SolWspMP-sol7th]